MLISKAGKLIEKVTHPLLDAYVETQSIPVGYPIAMLKVEKIPLHQWAQMLQFFYWVYEKEKSEALFYWFYNKDADQKWLGMPPRQTVRPSSVTTEGHELERDKLILDAQDRGYEPLLTVHTHADMSAFQSGQDKEDETTDCEFSLHMTIGKLSKNELEWHCRAKVCIPAMKDGKPVGKAINAVVPFNVIDLFEIEGFEEDMPDKLKSALVEYRVMSSWCAYGYKDNDFPNEWKNGKIYTPVVQQPLPPYFAGNRHATNNENKSPYDEWNNKQRELAAWRERQSESIERLIEIAQEEEMMENV